MVSEKILIIDDEENMAWYFKQLLSPNYEVIGATDATKGISLLNNAKYDLLLLDLRMPKIDGIEALNIIKRSHPDLPIIMITAFATVQTAVEAMKLGATDYITKPFKTEDIRKLIASVLKKHKQNVNAKKINAPVNTEEFRTRLITNNPELVKTLNIVQKAAKTDVSVLIGGESGTGKELVAYALHDNSSRKEQPFISINCAAIPENLIESELFGYEKGAFTGANCKKEGYFETANQSTLFLDEIGDLPLSVQAKLLRVLEEKKITRVGGTKKIPVDVRVVSASNKDLLEEVKKGNFREDLYFRLSVISILLPPLRERLEDIELLANYYLNHFSFKYNKEFKGFDDQAMKYLLDYPWPGNVRELKNLIERILIMEEDEFIQTRHLPAPLLDEEVANYTATPGDVQVNNIPLKEKVTELQNKLEREMIINALKEFNGNRTRAAEALHISRRSLQIKIKNLKIRSI